MALGGFAVLVAVVGGRPAFLVFMLASFLVSAPAQIAFHRNLNAIFRPSALVSTIRESVPPGSCVGYDSLAGLPTTVAALRFQLYKFHLYDYAYQRMTPERWWQSCAGPYLTLHPVEALRLPQTTAVARDTESGIYVIVKASGLPITLSPETIRTNDLYLPSTGNSRCLLAGCFSRLGRQLTTYSQVGSRIGDRLSTTGRAGFLFFGPYLPLQEGEYFVVLRGVFKRSAAAKLDVVSHLGLESHAEYHLCRFDRQGRAEVIVPFRVGPDTQDLEIRMLVSPDDDIRILGYEIVSALESSLSASVPIRCSP
jgi:hypothetical protein